MSSPGALPASISVRLLWPYIRLLDAREPGADPEGVTAWLVDPEARISHADAIRLMHEGIEAECDPARGLRAAALVEPFDREPLEQGARGCSTLGEAFSCLARWFPLLNSASELALESSARRAAVCYRVVRGESEPPAFADSVIAGLVYFTRRNANLDETGWELHFTQPRPSYAAEYARFFAGPVRFGASENALVLPPSHLAAPLIARSPRLTRAYQLRADQLLQQLRERDSTTGRVREFIAPHLGSAQLTMSWAAQQLGMSAATLRRKLRAENTTFSAVVEELRQRMAERKLREGQASIGEIAFALGFSNIGAFGRAFKRWSGTVPSDFRERVRTR